MTQRSKTKVDSAASSDELTAPIDLSLAKEYALYSDAHTTDVHTSVDDMIDRSRRLQLNTYQSFVRNLFNPLSDHKSLLLIHGTGTGKTITSLSVAVEYQKQYREYMTLGKGKSYDDIRSVIVIGYTRDIFKNELISHPEFGFVTANELTELHELQRTEHESISIRERLTNLKHKLYRRVSDRRMHGIFQFYGYRQLFSRVLNNDDLVAKLKSHRAGSDLDFTKLDANQLRQWVRDGSVRINKVFIESLKNCLLICDEVHNIYYQQDVNAYGLAVEVINDYYNEPKLYNPEWSSNNENCLRWLFLSATPLASSPTEIIPIVNLMNRQSDRLQYSDVFNLSTKELTPDGLSLIGRRMDSHVSYIMDDNPIQYPSSSFVGESIADIPYLKFIRCKMSEEHQRIYDEYLSTARSRALDADSDDNSGKGSSLKDFVFQSGKGTSKTLLYKYADVLDEIKSNTSAYKEDSSGLLISDTFASSSLGRYSEKYHRLMEQILSLKGEEHGKIFVYHPYVQSTGTNLLTSIMRANGLLELDETPSDNSICMGCDRLYKAHNCKSKNNLDDCDFVPVRFTVITGYVSKANTVSRLSQFNSSENSDGDRVKILLGSKAMRESHTLKACRHLMVVHQPASVSELIQIVGRGVRKHSHSLLPPESRNIKLYIFVSSMRSGNTLSSEERDYYEKMLLYKQILSIERVLFDQSLDYLINFRFKRREVPKLIGDAFQLDEKRHSTYKTMKSYPVSRMGSVRSNTFYFDQELDICSYVIKRILFEYQPLIAKSDMFDLVRSPPFDVEADLSLISDGAIEYTLSEMCYEKQSSLIIDRSNRMTTTVESLFDSTRLIVDSQGQHRCVRCATLGGKPVLYLDSVHNPITDLHKLIAYGEPAQWETQIDLESLANRWNSLVQIDAIIQEIQVEFVKLGTIQGPIMTRVSQFTVETHTKLIEYCLVSILSKVFHGKRITIDANLLVELVGFYTDCDVLITIKDTTDTIIGSLYKKYAIRTGSSWQDVVLSKSKIARINYSSVPIGHYAKHSPKIISAETIAGGTLMWNEYSSIVPVKTWTFPYKMYAYDERSTSVESVFKLKDMNDKTSKGINPMFMSQTDLQEVVKRLKIKVESGVKKLIIVQHIKRFVLETEARYRSEGKSNKIFFHSYENIHAS